MLGKTMPEAAQLTEKIQQNLENGVKARSGKK
jgi:hypothetical protein